MLNLAKDFRSKMFLLEGKGVFDFKFQPILYSLRLSQSQVKNFQSKFHKSSTKHPKQLILIYVKAKIENKSNDLTSDVSFSVT